MRTMLTIGLGALALAATARALPCDGKCEKACATVAQVKDAPHVAHAPAAPCVPGTLALTASTSVGGGSSCSKNTTTVAQPSCSGTVQTGGVRVDELATAIDAAVGSAAAPAAHAAPSPRPAAFAGGAKVKQHDTRSLEQRVAELERELTQRAPGAPAPRLSPVAAPRPPQAPHVIHLPHPGQGDVWFEDDDTDEDVDIEEEHENTHWFQREPAPEDDMPFGMVFEHGGDGDHQVHWFGAESDDCCDGDDPDCCGDQEAVFGSKNGFSFEGGRVRFVSPDGQNRFEVHTDKDGGSVRIEIVSSDGKTLHTETVRPGKVAVIKPDGERIEALVRRLNEHGVVSGEEIARVKQEVARALGQSGRVRERAMRQAERERAEAGRQRERALEQDERVERSRSNTWRFEAPDRQDRSAWPRWRVGGPGAGAADAPERDEALREVHNLVKEMRNEIEGLREELRGMRRELRSGQGDLHLGDDKTIR